MHRRFIAAALVALAGSALASPDVRACEEEGPGFIRSAIEATLAPEDAANIVVEQYEGTLVAKNIVLRGAASWSEGESEVLAGAVTARAVLLTTGDPATFLENRGILWLQYAFTDAASGAAIGSGEGFVTLERVAEEGGAFSFQGTVMLEGVERQFAGTGWAGLRGIVAAIPPLAGAPALGGGAPPLQCEEELPTLWQEAEVVVTGAKPGFFFESARNLAQLERQFDRARRGLVRERDARQRVLRQIR